MTDAVLFDARDDGIAIITINRPDTRNCLSREVREGLFAAWERFEKDDNLRIAILTGAGEKAFCAGGDLKEMVEKVRIRCRRRSSQEKRSRFGNTGLASSRMAKSRVDKLRRISRIRLPRRALGTSQGLGHGTRDAPLFMRARSRSLTIDQVIHVGACR